MKRPAGRFLLSAAWFGVAGLALATAVLWAGADRWWLVLPFAYGPRALVAPLLLPALILLVRQWRRGLPPTILGGVLLLWGILGFRIGPRRFLPAGGEPWRMVTYNVAGRPAATAGFLGALESLGVELAVVVECPGADASSAAPPGWQREAHGEFCLYSRTPIEGWTPIECNGERGSMAYAEIRVHGQRTRLGVVHLGSPHGAVTMFMDKSEIPTLGPLVRDDTRRRALDSEQAVARLTGGVTGPVIVAGDFNLSVESAIYRRYWSGFEDAFGSAGLGFGPSWNYRGLLLRIDHIMLRNGIRATRAWVGPDYGSDHLPVMADLVVTQ